MNDSTIKTILIIEDEQLYSKVLKNKLQNEGFNVITASDGEEGMTAARAHIPDIILMDLIMPIKDGFQTLQELKGDEKLKDIKVIISSNLGQEEDVKKVMALGAVDYLVKADSQFTDVIKKIKSHLQ